MTRTHGIRLDLNGLRFFYRHALQQELPWLDIVKPPKVQSMPDVLTSDEIARTSDEIARTSDEIASIIEHTRDLRLRAFWLVTYSMGLRLSETLNLCVGDIDRARMQVHIRQSKGRKDRFVILPALALAVLQRLWRSHRHPLWLFPGKSAAGEHAVKVMHRGTVQRAFRRVCQQCVINKQVSIHSLRHSYATHLIEAGLNLRSLQLQLGHSDPQTTARYVRLTEKSQQNSAELINQLLTILLQATPSLQDLA